MGLETGNVIANLVASNPTPGDPKSQGDDHLRLIKTAVKNCFAGFLGPVFVTGVDSGAANAYVLTPVPSLVSYGANMVVTFIPLSSSTGASTLNISSLGAIPIKTSYGADITVGDIVAGQPQTLMYSGGAFYQSAITKRYADSLSFSAALPNQAGAGGRLLGTDGTTAGWTNLINTSVMRFADSADTTKLVAVNAASITTGTTRTITMPDKDVILGQSMTRVARTSNTQIVQSDSGKLIDITANTFTQTFAAAATLSTPGAPGWYVYLRNSGTGDITLDPNGAELIDGMTSFIMYPNELRLIQCDGTTLTSVVINSYRKRYLSGGVWTKPPGYRGHGGVVCSAGASGVKSNSTAAAVGGSAGGAFPFDFTADRFGATEIVSVGAGGAAVTTANTNGNAGGDSSFGALVVVAGSGFAITPTTGGGNIPGAVVIGGVKLVNTSGQGVGFEATGSRDARGAVWAGGKSDNDAVGASASSVYGGGAGGSVSSGGAILAAGTSRNAGNGGAAGDAVSGTAGVFPAGGGGATRTGPQSGAGANGYVDVWGEL